MRTVVAMAALAGMVAGWLLDVVNLPAWVDALLAGGLCAALALGLIRLASRDRAEAGASSAPLVQEVLPVWQRHIDSARDHSEESMSGILASFGSISERLDEAVRATQGRDAGARSQSVDELLRNHDASVQAMLAPMRETMRMRDEALGHLEEIASAMGTLRQAALQIKQLARRTTMVALNASVEASRAGERGSGFAVVASEVEQLATQSGQVAQTMMSRTTAIEDQLAAMRVRTAAMDLSDAALQTQAEAAARVVVADLLGDLSQLSRTSRDLQAAGAAVQEEVERVLMNFQSQDRLTQMLNCVTDDMGRMGDWLAQEGDLGSAQADAWLERLDASYTMEEQRSGHHGNTAIQRETAIEFF